MIKKDIETLEDIKVLVDSFYRKAIIDDIIGKFFTSVIQLDFEVHMPIMYLFWESVLFSNAVYEGNPMVKHIELSKKERLTEAHFDRWISLWNKTTDEHFEGDMANKAKEKANMMKLLMLSKIQRSEDPGFIA